MPHMPDRPSLTTPMVQKPGDIGLGLRIIPGAPRWMIDRLLQVDQQQHGPWGWMHLHRAKVGQGQLKGKGDLRLTAQLLRRAKDASIRAATKAGALRKKPLVRPLPRRGLGFMVGGNNYGFTG